MNLSIISLLFSWADPADKTPNEFLSGSKFAGRKLLKID